MFTLVYLNGRFNRPETLNLFLESNIGASPLLRIDCVTPFHGTEQEMILAVCNFLNDISSQIVVAWKYTQNASTKINERGNYVHFLVVQIHIMRR